MKRTQETCQLVFHPGQRIRGHRATPKQQHGYDNGVGAGYKEKEAEVGDLSPAGVGELAHSVSTDEDVLEGDGEAATEEDLAGDLEGLADAVLPGNFGALEEGGGLGPMDDNGGGCEASLAHAAGSAGGAEDSDTERSGEDGGVMVRRHLRSTIGHTRNQQRDTHLKCSLVNVALPMAPCPGHDDRL